MWTRLCKGYDMVDGFQVQATPGELHEVDFSHKATKARRAMAEDGDWVLVHLPGGRRCGDVEVIPAAFGCLLLDIKNQLKATGCHSVITENIP